MHSVDFHRTINDVTGIFDPLSDSKPLMVFLTIRSATKIVLFNATQFEEPTASLGVEMSMTTDGMYDNGVTDVQVAYVVATQLRDFLCEKFGDSVVDFMATHYTHLQYIGFFQTQLYAYVHVHMYLNENDMCISPFCVDEDNTSVRVISPKLSELHLTEESLLAYPTIVLKEK